MKTLVLMVAMMLLVVPAFAGITGQVYGNGQKAATLCASLQMYEDVSFNGFVDLNRDGSWFSKTRLVEGKGNVALAIELRASSSGLRQFAVGPQIAIRDHAGAFQVNPWYDEDGNWVISVSQFHRLSDEFWTYSWTDVSRGNAKGTLRMGQKNARFDPFVEYRFNTATHDNGVFAGVSIH